MGLHIGKRRLPVKRRGIGHKHYAKEQRYRLLSVVVTSVFVLLLLAGIAGFAYAYYSGQEDYAPKQPIAEKEEPVEQKVPVPKKPVPVGVSVQLMSSPITPGSEASISIHTNSFAKCTIEVEYDEVPYTDKNLKEKVADEFGVVSWEWVVDEAVPLGTWPVTVTCRNAKYNGVAIGDLEVVQAKNSAAQ